jgi:hypothetical protein
MRYIHKFDTDTQFNEVYKGGSYNEPWVSYTEGEERVDYNKEKWPYGLLDTPLTFKILNGGNIVWTIKHDKTIVVAQYKVNNGQYVSVTHNPGDTAVTIPVNAGDNVEFKVRGTLTGDYSNMQTYSASTAVFNVSGNIMSLLDDTGFSELTTAPRFAFTELFKSCAVVDASKLLLPATTLRDRSYDSMFKECVRLSGAPSLERASSFGYYSCSEMFYGCTSLVFAPELPGEGVTLNGSYCFYGMFANTGVKMVKCLASPASYYSCSGWLNANSTGTFYTLSTIQWLTKSSDGIPAKWTRVNIDE